MPQAKAVAGINGGFFTPAFKPMGLMIADGKSTGSFESSALLGGCILQTATRPAILWRTEYQSSKGITQLIQCGPRLVNNRIPIPGLEKQKQRPRSFVATDANSAIWAIGTTGPCTLAELAQILSSPNILPNLRITRAINLDGGSSTAFWYQPTHGSAISQPGWDTVRNYLAIIPK
jgi:exopolysaccharide biosynthesis protein